jgi:hypothetical protein
MQRRFLDSLGVPQPRLLATIRDPRQLAALKLPSAWALKPVGGAYSQGLVLVDGGRLPLWGGLPYNVWRVIGEMRGMQALHGRPIDGVVGSSEVRLNCECFLIEELVRDANGGSKPVDYRVFVSGDTVLYVELTFYDAAISNSRQAAVDENYDIYPPHFDQSEVAWPLSTDACQLPPRPACWPQLLQMARQLGGTLGVFARLDWYADVTRGPLLGEITITPNMGESPALHTAWVNDLVRRHWLGPSGPPPAAAAGVPAASTLHDALSRCSHGLIVPWSASEISAAVEGFDLGPWGVAPGSRVALLLPNGGHAALGLLATMDRSLAAPH